MNLKFAVLLLMILSPLLPAQTPQIVFETKWGSEPEQVGLRSAFDGRYGPQAFRVNGDSVFILDEQNRGLKTFRADTLLQSIPVRSLSRDFAFKTAREFTLLTDDKLYSFVDGKQTSATVLPSGKVPQAIQKFPAAQNLLHFSDGENRLLESGVSLQKSRAGIQVFKRSPAQAEIVVHDPAKHSSFFVDFPNENLADVQFIGMDAKARLFIHFDLFIQQAPLKVKREVRVFDINGTHLLTYGIALNDYALIFRDLEVTEGGDLYQMIQLPDGLNLLKWKWPNGTVDFPLEVETPEYNWNREEEKSFGEPEPALFPKRADLPTVTPEQALAIGDSYVQLHWTCTADNLTNGVVTDSYGNHVETPDWLYVGNVQRVPYKWGGFNTIQEYLDGIASGKYAGDKATDSVSPLAVGVDCSGFVSRCWTLPTHYSTRMMDDAIARAYESWEQTLPGDICHRPGHVRLIVGHNPDGTLDMVEAAGFNWRVSYTNYRYSAITSYTPRYYINMQGRRTALATFNWTKSGAQSQIHWRVDDPSVVSEYHLYLSADGKNWDAEENIPADSTSFSLALPDSQALYYKLKCASLSNKTLEGFSSDGYGVYRNTRREKVLIVDGFDRTSDETGSWPHLYHNFAITHGRALQAAHIPFETVANEAVTVGAVALEDYAAVIWICGDESTVDETFSDAEQSLVKKYLQQGGQLFVSGSEIGWDLDHRGSADDQAFYHTFLKAAYVEDDAASYTVNGKTGTAFDSLSLHYDDGSHGVYEEDYPDAIAPTAGGQVALNYANGKTAAVSFSGMFSGGTKEGRLVYMAFPFETIYKESERNALMKQVVGFFDIPEIAAPEIIPAKLVLFGNYPNPFNGRTRIRFSSPDLGRLQLVLYDVLGRVVRKSQFNITHAGRQELLINAKELSSGMYVYRIFLKTGSGAWNAEGKFILIK